MTREKPVIPKLSALAEWLLFWETRIKSLKAEKHIEEEIYREEEEVLETKDENKKMREVCSIILRGLRDIPLSAVIRYSCSLKAMWDVFHEQYASTFGSDKGQKVVVISRKRYEGLPTMALS